MEELQQHFDAPQGARKELSMFGQKNLVSLMVVALLAMFCISTAAVAAQPMVVKVVTEYGMNPMTSGPHPTTTLDQLVAHFGTPEARQSVERWTSLIGHSEWTGLFYAGLSKATLKPAPAGTIPFYGEGKGLKANITSYVAFGMPKKGTTTFDPWIAANAGALTYWSVPIKPGVAVGVLSLCDNLFLPYGQELDYAAVAKAVAMNVSVTTTVNNTVNVTINNAPAPAPIVQPNPPAPEPEPAAVCGKIIAEPAKFKDGEPVQFSAKVENAIGYEWNFGDGTGSNKPAPSHRFSGEQKSYLVTLTVWDAERRESSCTYELERKGGHGLAYAGGGLGIIAIGVAVGGGGGGSDHHDPPPAVNHPPVCNGVTVSPESGALGTTFTFTASGSDQDGDTLSYSWSNGLTGKSVSVTPTAAGTFSLSVTISDGRGGQAACSGSANVTGGGGCTYPPMNQTGITSSGLQYVGAGGAAGYTKVGFVASSTGVDTNCVAWTIRVLQFTPGQPGNGDNLGNANQNVWQGDLKSGNTIKIYASFMRAGVPDYTKTVEFGPYTVPVSQSANMTAQSNSEDEKAAEVVKPRISRVVDIPLVNVSTSSDKLDLGLALGGTIFSGDGRIDAQPFLLGKAAYKPLQLDGHFLALTAEAQAWPKRVDVRTGVAVGVALHSGPVERITLSGSYLLANAGSQYDDKRQYGVADDGKRESGMSATLALTFWEDKESHFCNSFGARISLDKVGDQKHVTAGIGFSF